MKLPAHYDRRSSNYFDDVGLPDLTLCRSAHPEQGDNPQQNRHVIGFVARDLKSRCTNRHILQN